MLKYMKSAVKRAASKAGFALNRHYNEFLLCKVILYMTFTFAFNVDRSKNNRRFHIMRKLLFVLFAIVYFPIGVILALAKQYG